MNPAGLDMIEAGSSELVHEACIFNLIAPEHREDWKAHHVRVCGGERLRWEFDIVGLKGTRRHMETHAAPLILEDGPMAQRAITRDITERKRQDTALRDSERRARELLEALPAAIYTTDQDGRITFYNQAAEMWGHRPSLGTAEWCGSWRLYEPDGTPLPHSECPMAVALKEQRPIQGAEAIAERADGTRIPFIPFPTPLHDATGALVGAVNTLVDITDRKRAEEHQRLLINELNHWVKNTLATVQSIASQTLRNAPIVEAAKRFFRRLLKGLCYVPRVIVTDKLGSYGAAKRELLPSVEHRQGRYLNNRCEVSHQATRRRERHMRRFKSTRQAQQFLATHTRIHNHFQLRRHRLSAGEYRAARDHAFATWRDATGVALAG